VGGESEGSKSHPIAKGAIRVGQPVEVKIPTLPRRTREGWGNLDDVRIDLCLCECYKS
jgi:hypothetical protein